MRYWAIVGMASTAAVAWGLIAGVCRIPDGAISYGSGVILGLAIAFVMPERWRRL